MIARVVLALPFTLAIGSLSPPALADELRGHFGFSLATAAPFAKAGSADWGYGAGFLLGAGWGSIPLTAGFDFMAVRWPGSTRHIGVSVAGTPATLVLERSDQAIFCDLWLRLQPRVFRIRPYVEGVLGVKGLFADYSLSFVDGDGSSTLTSRESPASTYGVGFGVDVYLARNETGGTAYLSLGARVLEGSAASFTVAAPRTATVRDAETPTDTVAILAGITATID